jgi:hypothetical protein
MKDQEQKQQFFSNESNVLNTILSVGYSVFEVRFTVKLRRKNLMKWLENRGLIKEKFKDISIIVRDVDNVDYLFNDDEDNVCSLSNFRVTVIC